MNKVNIGILHPGQMGISVAATAANTGHTVYWASEGRSQQTSDRAQKHGLQDAQTLVRLCETCEVIMCVCPPHAAETVANQVLAAGFRGLYLDANAISPERARRIGSAMSGAGVAFVDGGIIGGPAWKPNRTWLYLSGSDAQKVGGFFSAGPLETSVIDDEIGKASALKMCYAAYTKGRAALVSAVVAAAESLGVRQELDHQWRRDGSDFADQNSRMIRRVTAKSWRFAGEMYEIAATFDHAGVPGGFHTAAGEIYRRMSGFKDAPATPELKAVLEALLQR